MGRQAVARALPHQDGDPRGQEGLAREIKLLNRIIQWASEGICWEPDPRHVELTLKDLGLDNGRATSRVTPGIKEEVAKVDVGCLEGMQS